MKRLRRQRGIDPKYIFHNKGNKLNCWIRLVIVLSVKQLSQSDVTIASCARNAFWEWIIIVHGLGTVWVFIIINSSFCFCSTPLYYLNYILVRHIDHQSINSNRPFLRSNHSFYLNFWNQDGHVWSLHCFWFVGLGYRFSVCDSTSNFSRQLDNPWILHSGHWVKCKYDVMIESLW